MPKKWLIEFTRAWIESIPKTINENGCWIPNIKPDTEGYCRISSNYKRYKLHRLMLCIYHNLDYSNQSWDARHSGICIRACFNPEHLKPGTQSDNTKDSVEHGTHPQSRKLVCPKCNSPYTKRKVRRYGVVTYERFCSNCYNEQRRLNRLEEKNEGI